MSTPLQKLSTRLRKTGWLKAFDADERGTALTEFVILLPVFVLVFVGLAHLGTLNRTAIRVGGTAYSQVWEHAKEAQIDNPGIHVSPGPSGDSVRSNMNRYTGLQEKPGMRQIVRHETNDMGQGLSTKGHMGESFERVERARHSVELRHIDGDVTRDIGGVTGDSDYAKQLFDDSSNASIYYPQQGAVSGMGRSISSPGLRPVVAAGMRYGSVLGSSKQSVDIGPKSIELSHYFTTLVAPHWSREDQAAAVTRGTLEGVGPYDNMLGVSTDQPLNRDSQSVTPIKGVFPSAEDLQ
jgi:hypothetical protein